MTPGEPPFYAACDCIKLLITYTIIWKTGLSGIKNIVEYEEQKENTKTNTSDMMGQMKT